MQNSKEPQQAAEALLAEAQEDIEKKRHKRDPFASKYVTLATSEFGGLALQADAGKDARRSAVEAATANVHIRVELIRSMKNALVKQTQEAAKRVAAPTQRQRLGTRRQRASAAAAAAGGGCAQDDNEEEGGVAARYFCDDMQEQFAALLQGEPPPPDLAAQLAQLLGEGGGDPTRLPNAELALDVAAELAPPPFEDYLQQLFGEGLGLEEPPGHEAAAPPIAAADAGLDAAVDELRQHMAQLEEQGALQLAAGGEAWLHLGDPGLQLPAYLAGSAGAQQAQQVQRGQPEVGPGAAPAWPASVAERCESEGMAGADDCAAAWQALEEEEDVGGGGARQAAAARPEPPAWQQLSGSAGSVAVAFDDEQVATAGAQHAQHAQQHAQQQQHAAQPRLTDLWELGGGPEPDPWAQLAGCEPEAAALPSAAPHSVLGAVAGGEEGERPPSGTAAHYQQQHQGDHVSDSDEEWDAGMLETAAALERAALEQRQQPGATPAPAAAPQLRAPVFRHRSFAAQQPPGGPEGDARSDRAAVQAGAAEGIEESGSEGETAVVVEQRAEQRAVPRRAGAVPAIGRRAALRLAPGAAPATVPASVGPGDPAQAGNTGDAPAASPFLSRAQHEQRESHCHPAQPLVQAAPPALQPAHTLDLEIDFAAMDVSGLRPSILLRQQAAGRRRWRPVLDPGTLLLPPLRAGLPLPPPPALPPPPPQPQQAQELAPAGNAAVEELVAGLTAADLADWDDWDEDSGLQGSDGQADQQQELVAVEWDAPPSPPVDSGQAKAAGAVEAGLGGCSAPAASAELADVTQDAEVAVLVQFDDCADFSAAEEEAQGQDAPAHQPPTAMQLPWLDALPEAAGGTSPAQQETPAAAGGDWPSDMGLARQGARTADSTAVDVWAELEAAPDEPSGSGAGSGQLPVGEAAWDAWAQPCSLAATLDEALMAGQERREAGQPDDPWTALEAAEDMQAREHAAAAAAEAVREPAAAAGQAMSVGWPSPGTEAGCARAVSLSSSPLAISMEADDEAEDGGAFGGWGCFEDWEGDSGGALGEQATNPLQQPPQGQIDHLAVSTGCEGTAQASARGTAGSPQQPQPAPPPAFDLEWQYDDEAEENVPPQQAASACAAAGWPRPQAVARVGAGKRRHEQIGEEIIQALLEERRQARVDLQPLLHQLGQRLGAALGGQAEGGAGSESSHPGGDRPVLLSSLRRDCMAAGGAEVQASTQRYLVALLTAANQHNLRAQAEPAAAAGQQAAGGSEAAPPLAAVLAGRQVHLTAPPGASDVTIAAA